MLRMELTKSSDDTSGLAYKDTNGHGTAIALRLVEPWFQSNRHVVLNSYFASVDTTVAMFDNDIRFTDVLKKAISDYPMSYFGGLRIGNSW